MPPHHTTIHTADTAVFSTLYLSAPDVVDLVRRTGIEACLRGIADNIHADFLRAFNPEGGTVPALEGVLIGADADNTADRSLGFVGDIAFGRSATASVNGP